MQSSRTMGRMHGWDDDDDTNSHKNYETTNRRLHRAAGLNNREECKERSQRQAEVSNSKIMEIANRAERVPSQERERDNKNEEMRTKS